MSSQIRIFIYQPSGAAFEIPVIPSSLKAGDGGSYERNIALGAGAQGFPGYRRTKTLEWDSFFPYHYDEGYCQYAALLHPADAVDFFIRSLAGTKVPGRPDLLHVKITEEFEAGVIWPLVDDQFVINDFNYSREAGELTDITYSIRLETLKIASLRITDSQAPVVPTNLSVSLTQPSTIRPDTITVGSTLGSKSTYTVKSGDWLTSIAAAILGDMSRWQEIYELNKVLIGPDPDLIFPGQVLTLPGGSSVGGLS